MGKQRLQITLNDEVLSILDAEAKKLGVTKSAVIAMLLNQLQQKNQQPNTSPARNG